LSEAVGSGADVIIDLVWGAPAMLALSAAATGARLVQVGNGAGEHASVPASVVRSKGLVILGYANANVPREERLDAYSHLAELAADGRITIDVERVPLDDVAIAWERQRAGADRKQILIPRS
jgi:NADPH2:quinone reductase